MIIDLILDRRDDREAGIFNYNPHDFYMEIMEYSTIFNGVGDKIIYAMDELEEKERRHTEKVDFLMGYAEGKTQIQVERIYNILSKVQSYAEGEKITYKSRRDFIRDIIAEGGKVRKIENMVYFYGSKWDRKEGRKTVLRAEEADGSMWEITKTEFEFGKYLMSYGGLKNA